MKLPSVIRRTPFRLTLLFLALFVATASAVMAYVYMASANEARARAESSVRTEVETLTGIYRARGANALNQALVDRTLRGDQYLYMLRNPDNQVITANISELPDGTDTGEWEVFRLTDTDADGRVTRRQAIGIDTPLSGGERLFVGEDIGDLEAYLSRLTQALWMAMVAVLVLGIGGGLLISRRVERAMGRLNRVVTAAQEGDMKLRVSVRNSGDELDELSLGLNTMLDKMEASMASIRHACDCP